MRWLIHPSLFGGMAYESRFRGEKMKLGKWMIDFKISFKVKKTEQTKGISSITDDFCHCVFIDYDAVSKPFMIRELQHLQKVYKLTPFYLFTTKEENQNGEFVGNYHCISLSKMLKSEVIEILKNSHCDHNYISMWKRNKGKVWVLRVIGKGDRDAPKYLGIIGEPINLDNPISEAHLRFLELVYDVDYIPYTKLDGLKTIEGHTYETYNV